MIRAWGDIDDQAANANGVVISDRGFVAEAHLAVSFGGAYPAED
jgi:hypothetical protein